MQINDPRKLIIKDRYDVIVVGGGIAGVAAAVASARNGAKTLLIEKQINLGGLATVGLISTSAKPKAAEKIQVPTARPGYTLSDRKGQRANTIRPPTAKSGMILRHSWILNRWLKNEKARSIRS